MSEKKKSISDINKYVLFKEANNKLMHFYKKPIKTVFSMHVT